MGIEFRLGRQDGHKVEDFLARNAAGVSAITLDTAYARYQLDAADAARAAGVDVLFDPATERMADAGFNPQVAYFNGEPIDVGRLSIEASARSILVSGVLEAHPDQATVVTPPHFFVHDSRSASLNVALAEQCALTSSRPVRASLVVSRKYAIAAGDALAREYADAGITAIDLPADHTTGWRKRERREDSIRILRDRRFLERRPRRDPRLQRQHRPSGRRSPSCRPLLSWHRAPRAGQSSSRHQPTTCTTTSTRRRGSAAVRSGRRHLSSGISRDRR